MGEEGLGPSSSVKHPAAGEEGDGWAALPFWRPGKHASALDPGPGFIELQPQKAQLRNIRKRLRLYQPTSGGWYPAAHFAFLLFSLATGISQVWGQ